MNSRFKAEILRRVFPGGEEVGCHKFRLEEPTCRQCGQVFWDWVFENEDGSVSVGMKLCGVMGSDEVDRFNREET